MLLTFFRTAVRAGSTRAVLTVVVGMLTVLVNLHIDLIARRCRLQAGAAGDIITNLFLMRFQFVKLFRLLFVHYSNYLHQENFLL